MINYDDESYTYSSNPLVEWWEDNYRITIWYAGPPNDYYGKPEYDRHKFDCELRDGDTIIFAKGDTYFSTSRFAYYDEPGELVRLAIELFTLAPGDTDPEFFDSYTADQLQWLNSWNKVLLECCSDYFASEFEEGYNSSLDGERG